MTDDSALSIGCDFNGNCDCKTGYFGDKCDSCIPGFYDSNGNDFNEKITCSDCLCNIEGSLKSDNATCTNVDPCPCNIYGVCTCKSGYIGDKCDDPNDTIDIGKGIYLFSNKVLFPVYVKLGDIVMKLSIKKAPTCKGVSKLISSRFPGWWFYPGLIWQD